LKIKYKLIYIMDLELKYSACDIFIEIDEETFFINPYRQMLEHKNNEKVVETAKKRLEDNKDIIHEQLNEYLKNVDDEYIKKQLKYI